jgi:outer membrane protein OmpA-like peptidoglycan-associated protein
MLIVAFAAGCVRAPPPQELVDARATYQRVATGPAAELNPTGVVDAKAALDRAEKSYEDHVYDVVRDSDYLTRDSAYVATRKAQLAEAQATVALNAREKAKLDSDLAAARQLQNERLEAAKRARAEPEQSLSDIASVRREARGMVLTLAGNIVFASGQYKLRGDSLPKLNRVAVALKDMGGKTFIVEGHTDSTGSNAANDALSKKRAASVREYLIRQGIPGDEIKAVGYGEKRPIAPNDTPEGRAKNRRVEIIVQPNPS